MQTPAPGSAEAKPGAGESSSSPGQVSRELGRSSVSGTIERERERAFEPYGSAGRFVNRKSGGLSVAISISSYSRMISSSAVIDGSGSLRCAAVSSAE